MLLHCWWQWQEDALKCHPIASLWKGASLTSIWRQVLASICTPSHDFVLSLTVLASICPSVPPWTTCLSPPAQRLTSDKKALVVGAGSCQDDRDNDCDSNEEESESGLHDYISRDQLYEMHLHWFLHLTKKLCGKWIYRCLDSSDWSAAVHTYISVCAPQLYQSANVKTWAAHWTRVLSLLEAAHLILNSGKTVFLTKYHCVPPKLLQHPQCTEVSGSTLLTMQAWYCTFCWISVGTALARKKMCSCAFCWSFVGLYLCQCNFCSVLVVEADLHSGALGVCSLLIIDASILLYVFFEFLLVLYLWQCMWCTVLVVDLHCESIGGSLPPIDHQLPVSHPPKIDPC